MHRASWAELCMYLMVVLATVATVLPSMAHFSHKAIPAILQSAVTGTLPARLTSILDISPDYIAQHYPALQHRLTPHLPRDHNTPQGFQAATSWASNVPILAPCAELVQRFLNLPRDVSDVQWKEFRGSLGLLAAGMLAYVALSNLAKHAGHTVWLETSLLAALAFLGILHNTQTVWPLALALATYHLSHLLAGRKHGPAVMWAFQVGLLVYIRYNDGMGFGRLSPGLAWLDGQGGMLRWWIHHNLAMLRMISYYMDLHWSKATASAQHKKVVVSPAVYQSLPMYLLYCFYPPLYIAGPIITYSSWASQVTAPSRVPTRQVVTYALRWVAALFILEAFTRLYHFNAMAKYGLLTRGILQAQGMEVPALYYILTAFIVLIFMWLKFLVIWRFFRLVSLANGVDPPENMKRCICNNYDVQGFWQGWHSSYNRWLVRYMYVPLGGSTWRVANVWVCFLFVALWHDLDLRLLAWGLLMPAAFLPEIGIKALGRSRALQPHTQTLWFRHVAALLGTCNIVALVCANLVGFVTGLDGFLPLLQQVLSQPSTVFSIVGVVWCAVQLMFALREREADWKQAAMDRKGVHGE